MEKSRSEKFIHNSPESWEINKEKEKILEYIKAEIQKSKDILSARVYGSWLHSEKSIDLDICVMIPSEDGVVEPNVYQGLKIMHKKLSKKTAQDVDLVPHTLDELTDYRSTLYYPRYNPSLVSGKDIKGKLEVSPIFDKADRFTYADLAAYILLDNRTICRRQIARSLNPAESKVFASKILHGPGNALTYYSCEQEVPYLVSPSDLSGSLKVFDQVYGVNSEPANNFLFSCKDELNFKKALALLKWYEYLVTLVLYNKDKYNKIYQNYCLELEHFNIK